MEFKKISLLALYVAAQIAPGLAAAQAPSTVLPKATSAGPAARESTSINTWLLRLHEASKRRNYVGTYVVSSGGQMQSAKIWHVCEGGQQVERVESLTGAPRSTFRHNEKVVTFMPERKIVRTEKAEPIGNFPELVQSADNQIAKFYKIKAEGVERIAGLESDVVLLVPKDNMRFGYRVWTEREKGLVLQLQTLDANGRVLEQAAFSELQFDVPVQMDRLLRMMGQVDGYRVEESALVKTTASAEGWELATPVAGFVQTSCVKRPTAKGQLPDDPMQWVFSDGLASVSLFVEPFDRQKKQQESAMSMGATHTITHRMGSYWVTAMGEVPMSTLKQFVNGLERKK